MNICGVHFPGAGGTAGSHCNEMKPGLLRIASAVGVFVCAALAAAALYWLYANGHGRQADPLLVMPSIGIACGALAGLGVGVLARRALLGAVIGAVCLWPFVIIVVLLCLPMR